MGRGLNIRLRIDESEKSDFFDGCMGTIMSYRSNGIKLEKEKGSFILPIPELISNRGEACVLLGEVSE